MLKRTEAVYDTQGISKTRIIEELNKMGFEARPPQPPNSEWLISKKEELTGYYDEMHNTIRVYIEHSRHGSELDEFLDNYEPNCSDDSQPSTPQHD